MSYRKKLQKVFLDVLKESFPEMPDEAANVIARKLMLKTVILKGRDRRPYTYSTTPPIGPPPTKLRWNYHAEKADMKLDQPDPLEPVIKRYEYDTFFEYERLKMIKLAENLKQERNINNGKND